MVHRYPKLKKNWNEFRFWKTIYNERKKVKKEVKIEIAERFAYSDIHINYEHTELELKEITEQAKDTLLETITEEELRVGKTRVTQTKKALKIMRLNKKYVNEIAKKMFKLCEESTIKVGESLA
jgi:hypothetical protein